MAQTTLTDEELAAAYMKAFGVTRVQALRMVADERGDGPVSDRVAITPAELAKRAAR
jgi:hypothetical protein